ncbi:ABC-2 family transporter protein [Actinocrinis puniceicyclus]|uniref:ABC-2 family transporter protein n=1 Tax=Actinocrinis puniceicyclus TaxID=977794 RepID=A0A8J8BBY0_9ACTN|nr:ABC-2 family transporter protein [Actinocrinis puniceicyclus]MBS2962935.1 ABC-2 family transporter protein [Actinocrinis puniceicyclus]
MADADTDLRPRGAPATRPLPSPVAYLLLTRMWSRAAWQYRTSLLLTGTAQMLVTSLDLAALLVLYSQVTTLAGFTLPQTLYLYGTTRLAFALSDVVASGVETLSDAIRLGTFDVMLIRPVGTLAQVLSDQFTPKRLGKLVPSSATLVWAIYALPITWTPLKGAVCAGTVLCGTVIYCALWVITGSISFVATDARETANVITYGGELVTEFPFAIYQRSLALILTFAIPLAFITWQPSLYVLGRSDPFGLPAFLHFAAPAVAALLCALAAFVWRAAVRRYRSTGS